MKAPTSLTVMCELREGALEDARDQARRWNDLPHSPFSWLSGVHLGRVQVVEHMERHVKKAFEEESFLLVSIDHDGDLEALLDAMGRHMGAELDALMSCCVDWPGSQDRRAVHRWIRDRRVKRGVEVIAYPAATVERVTAAIATHDRVVRFACATQDVSDPAELRRAFLAAFPEHVT